jgi:plasmid stabilization system protein ParE
VIVPVRTTQEADVQIEAVAAWWKANREAAPDLFGDELAGAVELLTHAPDLGKPVRHKRIPGLRRLLLPATRYHVYYVHEMEADEVVVLAVWNAVRGRSPRLTPP